VQKWRCRVPQRPQFIEFRKSSHNVDDTMKVLIVFGTRPEAIKLAPVIRELTHRHNVNVLTCSTGQHRQMLDQVLQGFSINPDFDLNLMQGSQTLNHIAANVIVGLDSILVEHRPDWVLVQGDTTTVVAAALAASYNKVKVGHVEAGLRSYDRAQPFPEETNRCLATVISDLHFAPTEQARQNLLHEGVPCDRVFVTGNTVIDALKWASSIPYSKVGTIAGQQLLEKALALHSSGKKLILVTAHRRENFGEPLSHICSAILEISAQYPDSVHFFYPVHLNPNVEAPVHSFLSGQQNVTLTPPLDYFSLIQMMKMSYLILTDSGGIQEEAPSLGVPVLVLRDATERVEAVRAGSVRLVGTATTNIVYATVELLEDNETYLAMKRAINPYGDGNAATRIVDVLCDVGSPVPQVRPKIDSKAVSAVN
jgi:UDP-N-acetylglucosamine 2-epimerase (non-hydrolysing)